MFAMIPESVTEVYTDYRCFDNTWRFARVYVGGLKGACGNS